MTKDRWLSLLALVLLSADLSVAFYQYYTTPMDGDMAAGILPNWDVQMIFDDPFGIGVILGGEGHPNPNRVVAHWTFMEYYQHGPILLQSFTDPISSVYLTSAIAKLLCHIAFLLLISLVALSGPMRSARNMLLSMALLSPLVQFEGFNWSMGLVANSPAYLFFYAIPCIWLFAAVLGYRSLLHGRASMWRTSLLGASCVLLPFSGPLVPGLILITAVTFVAHRWLVARTSTGTLPRVALVMLVVSVLLSAYSLYLGTFNTTYEEGIPTVWERYRRLPAGLWEVLDENIAIPLLLFAALLNAVLLWSTGGPSGRAVLRLHLPWLMVALLYLALLPLGGWRPYRDNLLRSDTLLPVTFVLLCMVASGCWGVHAQRPTWRWLHLTALLAGVVVFANADLTFEVPNACERRSLEAISNARGNLVPLKEPCSVLSWDPVPKNPLGSDLNARLLLTWRITDRYRTYYYSNPDENSGP